MTTSLPFADRIFNSSATARSFLCAGFDPDISTFPAFLIESAARAHSDNENALRAVLVEFYSAALRAMRGRVACVKPNIAFFEQYGIGGLRAFSEICALAKDFEIPVIADIKRGDIASTAQAYSNAFLAGVETFGVRRCPFEVDAITINPFLGFDTVDIFVKDAANCGKGLFVLVRTSNPGASALQESTSRKIADYLHTNRGPLLGRCGFSGLGAVVGATYPQQARELRELMPDSFFLIPGFGAQGGTADDALAGAHPTRRHGIVVNSSRGLFGKLPPDLVSIQQLEELFLQRCLDQGRQLTTEAKMQQQ